MIIVHLRKGAPGDAFDVASQRAGATAVLSVPLLRIEPCGYPGLDALLEMNPLTFRGFVVTSQYAAVELAAAMARQRLTHSSTAQPIMPRLPCYVVGMASARILAAVSLELLGCGAPSAEALADEIVTREAQRETLPSESRLPLLFLCGDQRLETIPARVSAAGIALTELVVYRSVPVTAVEARKTLWALLRDVRNGAPTSTDGAGIGRGDSRAEPVSVVVMTVFSPSGARVLAADPLLAAWIRGAADATLTTSAATADASEGAPCSATAVTHHEFENDGALVAPLRPPLCRVRLVAMGSTTADALRRCELPVAAQSAYPDADSAVNAIMKLNSTNS